MKLILSGVIVSLAFLLSTPNLRAQAPSADPYEELAKFQFGQSRLPLATIEEQIRKTAPEDYKAVEAKFLAILKAPQTPKDAKRFICRWLAVVGSAECVPAVAELLTDEDLSHMARIALEPMAAPAAGEALRAALPKVKGNLLVGMISSLGVRRDAQAVGALSRLVTDRDASVAGTAITALGRVGSEEAARALDGTNVPEGLARTLARARINAASQLTKAGRNPQALSIFRSLMSAQQPPAIRVAALKGQIAALPQTEAAKFIIAIMQGEDPAMRAATIAAYSSSTDRVLKDAVAGELPRMKPDGQLILLGVLADEPEAAARPAVLTVLKGASDDKLRVAALECLARHGEAADVPMIAGLANGPSAPVAETARKTLLRMGKPGVDDALVRLIESPEAGDRAVALATLGNRRAESALPTLVRLMGGADAALAVEAAKGLAIMGKGEQLKDVVKVMVSTDNATLRAATEEAAKTICRRSTDSSASPAVLIAALEQPTATPARVALLQVLAHTGGEQALNAVVKAMGDKDNAVRAAATRSLVAWPEASAVPRLLELARNTPDAGQAVVALRDGCLRLAEMEEIPLAQRVNILRGVLEVAKRPEEKKRAISLLADVPALGSLEVLQTGAKDPALQADIVKAAIRLAKPLGAVYTRQTLAALQGLKTQTANDDIRQQVDEAIKAVQNAGQSPEGFILGWMLSGPYTEQDKDSAGLFDVAFAPEKPGTAAEWRPVTGSKSGLVELDKILHGDNRVAYLRTEITSGKDQEALLEMGSDDGIKVWLNGKVVHANNTIRPCTPGSDKAKIKLKQGANALLVKVTQGGGEWSACCRLRGPDGKELADATVAPNAE